MTKHTHTGEEKSAGNGGQGGVNANGNGVNPDARANSNGGQGGPAVVRPIVTFNAIKDVGIRPPNPKRRKHIEGDEPATVPATATTPATNVAQPAQNNHDQNQGPTQ